LSPKILPGFSQHKNTVMQVYIFFIVLFLELANLDKPTSSHLWPQVILNFAGFSQQIKTVSTNF
jgi:hypothetical protein